VTVSAGGKISSERVTVKGAFEASAANLLRANNDEYLERISEAVDLLCETFEAGRKVLVYGNGGSSADAQHICGELVGRFLKDRRGLSAIALSDNEAFVTAWGNDYHFESVFERQVQAHGRPGDVAWGLSTSGNSENVIRAHRSAREIGMKTIGLTGPGGGQLGPWCDVLIAASGDSTPRIQEVHLVTYHVICAAVEERMFAGCVKSTAG